MMAGARGAQNVPVLLLNAFKSLRYPGERAQSGPASLRNAAGQGPWPSLAQHKRRGSAPADRAAASSPDGTSLRHKHQTRRGRDPPQRHRHTRVPCSGQM